MLHCTARDALSASWTLLFTQALVVGGGKMTNTENETASARKPIVWPFVLVAALIAGLWGFVYNVQMLVQQQGGRPAAEQAGYEVGFVAGGSLLLAGLV